MTKSIKKTLALILSVMMLMSALPMTYSFADDYGDYTYSRSGSQATITKYNGSEAVVEIPDNFGSYATVVAIGDENGNSSPFYGKETITTVTVPDTVKLIGYSAFRNCKGLKTVTLGVGVETICPMAFSGCSALATVTIGANVKSIASNAFSSTNITTVNYGGTRAQWAALIGDIKDFNNAVIICKHDCATDGHKGVEIPAVPATCTESGVTAGSRCEICEKIITTGEVIPAKGHTPDEAVKENEIPATCETAGSYDSVVYCAVCDYEISREAVVTDELGHNIVIDTGNIRFKTEPTCTDSGIMIQYCYRCEKDIDVTVAPYGHKEVAMEDVAASCTEEGSKGGTKCSVCNEILVAPETVPVTAHTPDEAVKENEIPATCETAGSYDSVVYCAVCDYEISREAVVTDELGHNIVIDTGNIRFKTEPTCTDSGIMIQYCYRCEKDIDVMVAPYGHKEVAMEDVASTCTVNGSIGGTECSVCGITLVEPEVAPLAEHTRVEGVYEAPTCTDNGYKGRVVCEVCGVTLEEGEIIPAAHKFELVAEVAPSCEGAGSKTYKCTECGETKTETVDALGHDYPENWTVILPATCTERGSQIKICGVCNNINSEIIPAFGHTEVIDAAVAPTCTETGLTEGLHCSVCNTVFVKQETVDALGHTWIDATCTAPKTCSVCNKTEGEALGHTPAEAVSENIVEATCYAEGSYEEVVYCSVEECGAELSREEKTIDKIAHTPAEAVSENIVEATCYAEGSYEEVVYCSLEECGAELSREEKTINKIAHTPAEAVSENIVEATCYAEGSYDEVVYCSVEECEAELSREEKTIDKIAHTPAEAVRENVVNATCYAEGSYDEVVYCSVEECEAELSREEKTINKIAHTPAEAVSENIVGATCYAEGSYDEVVYCSVEKCEAELSREEKTISKIAHTPAEPVTENIVEATCYAEGSYEEVVYCSVEECEAELSREEKPIDKIDHTPADPVIENVVEATCYTEGSYEEVVYCSVEECEAELSREDKIIPPLGHDHVIDEEASTAPTCTEKGLNKFVCSRCGDTYSEDVDALGHDYVIDEDASTAPSCTEKGTDSYICVRCDDTYTEELDALGHNVTNWITSDSATCTKEGSRVGRCIVCYTVVREKTDKLDHKDENGDKKCDVCGTVLETEKPEDPTTPSDPVNPENPSQPDKPADPETPAEPDECSCYCHKSGIIRFFLFDIPLIFLRIFGLNKYCACGKAHY